jgi:hypothetical protein
MEKLTSVLILSRHSELSILSWFKQAIKTSVDRTACPKLRLDEILTEYVMILHIDV